MLFRSVQYSTVQKEANQIKAIGQKGKVRAKGGKKGGNRERQRSRKEDGNQSVKNGKKERKIFFWIVAFVNKIL